MKEIFHLLVPVFFIAFALYFGFLCMESGREFIEECPFTAFSIWMFFAGGLVGSHTLAGPDDVPQIEVRNPMGFK